MGATIYNLYEIYGEGDSYPAFNHVGVYTSCQKAFEIAKLYLESGHVYQKISKKKVDIAFNNENSTIADDKGFIAYTSRDKIEFSVCDYSCFGGFIIETSEINHPMKL